MISPNQRVYFDLETWLDIAGYEGRYQISNLGNVKSLSRQIDCKKYGKRTHNEKVLKPRNCGSGYHGVSLGLDGTRKNHYIHRLVMSAFLGVTKLEIDHIDGDKANNNLSNLRYCKHRQNVQWSSLRKKTSSRYVGVHFDKKSSKWMASIRINGSKKYLGLFDNEIMASEAYNNKLESLGLSPVQPEETTGND